MSPSHMPSLSIRHEAPLAPACVKSIVGAWKINTQTKLYSEYLRCQAVAVARRSVLGARQQSEGLTRRAGCGHCSCVAFQFPAIDSFMSDACPCQKLDQPQRAANSGRRQRVEGVAEQVRATDFMAAGTRGSSSSQGPESSRTAVDLGRKASFLSPRKILQAARRS